ncbi:hypothetical protein Celaphus_00011349, partial [Cervus elaphus hippelaphus]
RSRVAPGPGPQAATPLHPDSGPALGQQRLLSRRLLAPAGRSHLARLWPLLLLSALGNSPEAPGQGTLRHPRRTSCFQAKVELAAGWGPSGPVRKLRGSGRNKALPRF